MTSFFRNHQEKMKFNPKRLANYELFSKFHRKFNLKLILLKDNQQNVEIFKLLFQEITRLF